MASPEFTKEAIKHWAAWARSGMFYRNVCRSIESEYAKAPERYVHDDDIEMRLRSFKHDLRMAEKVENIICSKNTGLNIAEKRILVNCDVIYCYMTYSRIARLLNMPEKTMMKIYSNACIKIGRAL